MNCCKLPAAPCRSRQVTQDIKILSYGRREKKRSPHYWCSILVKSPTTRLNSKHLLEPHDCESLSLPDIFHPCGVAHEVAWAKVLE